MSSGNHESDDLLSELRSYEVMRLELTHLRSALAASPYPLVGLHALVLLGLERDINTSALAEQLGLDSQAMEQLVRALVRSGDLRAPSRALANNVDSLKLTVKGHRTLRNLHSACSQHVSAALALLDVDHHFTLTLGAKGYRNVFST